MKHNWSSFILIITILLAQGLQLTTSIPQGGPLRITSATHAGMNGYQEAYKVILVTGDVVNVINTTKGLKVVSIDPADPTNKGQGFQITNLRGHLYVIPSYVDAKKYDHSLFDITYLVKERYYNMSLAPLILKASGSSAIAAIKEESSRQRSSAKTISSLLKFLALSVKNERDSLKNLFEKVLESKNVERVWLDKMAQVSLNVSVPLIGAPKAWNLGYNGSGVKIAILDTGIDPTHPDFRFANGNYKVVLNQSFVDYPSEEIGNATDLQGHGTHVASITAGIGRASLGHSGAHVWFSGVGNYLDNTLDHTFDLTAPISATLKFWTQYDTEVNYDYGYVKVSVNGGFSWTTLDTYNGYSGAAWTQKVYDLTPFVGNNIILRFQYVTDVSVVRSGWYVDDIEIPEIGFSDDVESGVGGWMSNGWEIKSAAGLKGVAPGALLMVGKVLNRYGWGYNSWIISGIDWAVNNGANIISMSLGGDYTDGTDPLAAECDWATGQGVTVVVAAGNSGPYYYTATTPGTAFDVITVGASDDYDGIASFSSRGPTPDLRIKPDIVAPGVNIIAARASGGEFYPIPGNTYYTELSGTSMATPHVAGATAIVLQRFPSLSPADVKNLLLSTSNFLPGYDIYQQGAGRLNVSYAVKPVLFMDPAEISLKAPASTIVYTSLYLKSLYGKSVTLTFNVSYSSVDHPEVPYTPGGFYIMNTSVILPAGGETRIVFKSNFALLPSYDFWGVIRVLNASDTKQVLAHGIFSAFSWFKLSVLKLDRDGYPLADEYVVVLPNSTIESTLLHSFEGYTNSSGKIDFYAPAGLYNIYTDRYDYSYGNVYQIVKQLRLSSNANLILNEGETHEVKLEGQGGLIPTEKGTCAAIPFYRYDEYYDFWWLSPIEIGWLIYYPSSLSDYILTPYPVFLGYKLVPMGKSDPTNPDLIESDVLFMPGAFFSAITSDKSISPTYNVSTNIEYRTYATPRVSEATWLNHQMCFQYNDSSSCIWGWSMTYYVNAPKSLLVRTNPLWLNTDLGGLVFAISAEKYRDLPGVSTPYWRYFSWSDLQYLYDNGVTSSQIYVSAEPEYRRTYSVFKLEDDRLTRLNFTSYLWSSLNSTYCSSCSGTYYDVKVSVNGIDITNSVNIYYSGPYIEAWTENIDFSLPAKVEVFTTFTRDHTLSTSLSTSNTFIVENFGNGWYGFVPLEFGWERAIDVDGLDWNNSLTTTRPVKVSLWTYSYYDLSKVTLKYKYGTTWYEAALSSFLSFSRGTNTFNFVLHDMANRSYVDLSISMKDVEGNTMEQNITKAFYVNATYPIPYVYKLDDFPEPLVNGAGINTTIIMGTSSPHGPCGSAHTLDTVGGMSIAAKLGNYGSVAGARFYLDTDVGWYDGTAHKVYYWPVEGLTNVVTVAGPGVNMVTWRYFANPWYAPAYMYYDGTLSMWVIVTPTAQYKESDWVGSGPLKDLVVVEMIHVAEEGRYVLWVGGFGGYASRAGCLLIQLQGTSTLPSLKGTAMLVQWIDSNGNAKADPADTWNVVEIVNP